MISTYIAMQSAINSRNNAIMQMYMNTDSRMKSMSFSGKSQMMIADTFEMQNYKNSAKISFLNRWIEALSNGLKESIARSVPKYSGIVVKK